MDLCPGHIFFVQASVTQVSVKIFGWRGVSFVSFTHGISSFNLWGPIFVGNQIFAGLWGRNFVGN